MTWPVALAGMAGLVFLAYRWHRWRAYRQRRRPVVVRSWRTLRRAMRRVALLDLRDPDDRQAAIVHLAAARLWMLTALPDGQRRRGWPRTPEFREVEALFYELTAPAGVYP